MTISFLVFDLLDRSVKSLGFNIGGNLLVGGIIYRFRDLFSNLLFSLNSLILGFGSFVDLKHRISLKNTIYPLLFDLTCLIFDMLNTSIQLFVLGNNIKPRD